VYPCNLNTTVGSVLSGTKRIEPIAAARFAVVRVTTPLGTIKFPDVTYLMQLPKITDFRLSEFVGEYAVRCTGCNRLKLIKNLWFHGRGEQFCYKCM
jgi:hypothetical protein